MSTVGEIATSIQEVGSRLKQQFTAFGWNADQPLSEIVGGSNISLSATTLAGYSDLIAARVTRLSKAQLDIDGFGVWLNRMPAQLNQLQFNALNQGQTPQFTNALSMLQMINAAIPPIPQRDPKVNWEDLKGEKGLLPRDLMTRLRSVETRLKELEPRSNAIETKITDIENAHTAAEQLPSDLADLAEKKDELRELVDEASELSKAIVEANKIVDEKSQKITKLLEDSQARIAGNDTKVSDLIKRSEHALRGATSVGLSKSFAARKEALAKTSFYWTLGLIVSLASAVGIGWERVSTLKEVLNGDKPPTVIVVNALLAILGVGAPVWFAWLATKQIGTTFRLSEDYAFKASVAQAYEGYRSEAITIDESLRSRLFSSALDRFEEAPIRLIDPTYHSSPLQELLNNPALRKALDRVPGIAEKVLALIPGKSVVGVVAPAVVTSAVVSRALVEEKADPED